MTSLNENPFDCPTLQNLNVDVSLIDTSSPLDLAKEWLSAFEASISDQNMDSILSLFHEHGFWKDMLTLTWDFRTIRGHVPIHRLLDARLAATRLSTFHLLEDTIREPAVITPFPGLLFIRLCFNFETTHGTGTAIAFLVPTPGGNWKAWSLLTCLGGLKAHPEKIGAFRARLTDHTNWQDRRQRDIGFEDSDPTVLIIGAGHSGLDLAARLTHLGIPTLVIDRNQRVGDNWRNRYNALCLHTPIWLNPMPYLDFPKTFPVYCPASKVADWLESYATALDLNVWPSSSISSTSFSQETGTWQVSINQGGKARSMTVKHLVFATGWGGGIPNIPNITGKESYRGIVFHSTQFTSGVEHQGKKVIVVGAGTSAHDIAHDMYRHGCDVTMIQRSPTYVISREALEAALGGAILIPVAMHTVLLDRLPVPCAHNPEMYNEQIPTDFSDLLNGAFPHPTQKHLWKTLIAHIANGKDKELLDNLAKAGFRTWLGPDGGGFLPLILQKGGGLYVDIGTSAEIINGSIKVKSSPQASVRRFTEEGLELEDGTVLDGDVIVFATGFGNVCMSISEVCGANVAAKVGKVWGFDAEGGLNGVWRKTGYPRLWIAMSDFAHSRFHSLHLALRMCVCSVLYD